MSIPKPQQNKDGTVIAHVKKTVIASASGVGAVASVQVAAAAIVPGAMSAFGTIVPGVGTIHASGVEATLQCFSVASVAMPAAIAGGGAYLLYEHHKQIKYLVKDAIDSLKAKL